MEARLVQWDSLEFRLSGSRLETIARAAIERGALPVEDLTLTFADGELRVHGKVRKGLPIPFQLVVRRISAGGQIVLVWLERMSAFGFLPVPSFLTRLVGNQTFQDGVVYRAESNSVVIQLDRFLPSMVDIEVAEIRVTDSGLAIRLGRGGADLPLSVAEETHGAQ